MTDRQKDKDTLTETKNTDSQMHGHKENRHVQREPDRDADVQTGTGRYTERQTETHRMTDRQTETDR